MALRLAMLLLLGCASLPVAATELPQKPGEGCDDTSCGDPTNPHPAKHRVDAGSAEERARMRRDDAPDSGVRTPRWHSFLPGMFR